MEHATDRLQDTVECGAVCEVLQWPDCGRPPHTITHPSLSEAAKPSKPTHVQFIYVVVAEAILKLMAECS